MNFGFMAASFSMMSTRKPLGRSWYVGGNSETRLSQNLPVFPAEITNRPSAVGWKSVPVVSARSNFCQCPLTAGVSAWAYTCEPSAFSRLTLSGPENSVPAALPVFLFLVGRSPRT